MYEKTECGDPYNVAGQLHIAFSQHPKSVPAPFDLHDLAALAHDTAHAASPALLATPPSDDADLDDYPARRMSSSAASDDSLQSRTDKRAFDFSPSASPAPKRPCPDPAIDNPAPWDAARSAHDDPASPRVQLPSLAATFHDRHEPRRNSLPTLLDSNRLRLPAPAFHRQPSSSALGLSAYEFPPADDRRPRLPVDTQLGLYTDYSLPSTALSSSSSFSLPASASPLSGAPAHIDDPWAAAIVRPSSTPSQVPSPGKYDDALRHASLSTQGLYGGVSRISGHLTPADRAPRTSLSGPAIKSENEWFAPGSDFALANANAMPSPSMAGTTSPQRSPQAAAPALSTLVDRPPRKRGKLPKPVTDFLKDWLHRHSDHPYPSEEEKKALCHATGLSMSQVSNWMINARRRILAPAAVRGGAGPTTNNPYNTAAGRSVLDARRASVAGGEPMSLYYPMSLQSLPDGLSTRQMVGMTRSMSSSHASAGALGHGHGQGGHGHHPYGMDGAYGGGHAQGGRLAYGGGGALHPSQHAGGGGGGYLGVPLSAPASLAGPHAFLGHGQTHGQGLYAQGGGGGGGYGGRGMTPEQGQGHGQGGGGGGGARYTFPDAHAQSVSPQPGSGYNTPH